MELSNNTILITGGTSGFGLEFAKRFLSLGKTVIITGRNQEKLDEVKRIFPAVHTLKTRANAAIVNVTSGIALMPFPIAPIYSASKSGLRAYTKTLRVQLEHTGIKVLELAAPGSKTPLNDKFTEDRAVNESGQRFLYIGLSKNTVTTMNINMNEYVLGWKRTAFLTTLLLVSIVGQIDRVLPFILGESIKKELGLSDTQLGLITGLGFAVCHSLAALPLARISDRGGAKKVLVVCIVIWSALTGLGGMATGFLTLMLLRFGVALGEAGGTPASHFLITQKLPGSIRGRAIGLFSMGLPLGTMLGFALGGWASDNIGWRNALFAAGALGLVLAVLAVLFVQGNKVPAAEKVADGGGLLKAGRNLLRKPAFLWLFVAANLLGFGSAPFYVFTTPFLIRTYGLTASEIGLKFGLMQGLLGIAATLLGGRSFDRAIARNSQALLRPPAIMLFMAAICTTAALFMPTGNGAIALLVPGMFSFAFLLPYAFGSGHLVAGSGNKALSTALLLLAAGLLGPSLAPVLVGFISDQTAASNSEDGLRWGLLMGPLASLLCTVALFIANKRLSAG